MLVKEAMMNGHTPGSSGNGIPQKPPAFPADMT